MKYMTIIEKYGLCNLQLFAEGYKDGNGDDSGEDMDDDGRDEKKFSQKDVDATVAKRLIREKRKWQRDQNTKKSEKKLVCYEEGVTKESVDDVTALADAYVVGDENLDFKDAVKKVVKKYPHFTKQFEGRTPLALGYIRVDALSDLGNQALQDAMYVNQCEKVCQAAMKRRIQK